MKWKVVMALIVLGMMGMWNSQRAYAFNSPSDEPGWNGKSSTNHESRTANSELQGFWLGCRWIDSAKDIPVPEEVKERWEKLLRSARIENEEKRQNILAQWRLQWQKEEFRQLSREWGDSFNGMLLYSAEDCKCTGCHFLIAVADIADATNCVHDPTPPPPEQCRRCVYCVDDGGEPIPVFDQTANRNPDGSCPLEGAVNEFLMSQAKACSC